jgi:hypothetical protein
VYVGLASLAQHLEGRGVAAALGQAVPAVPECVRARREPRAARPFARARKAPLERRRRLDGLNGATASFVASSERDRTFAW